MQPLLSKSTLMVVANPFASPLDADGNPCTFEQYDPEHVGGNGLPRYIGCRLERKIVKPKVMSVAMKREGRRQYPRIETRVFYDLTPTPIVHSAYHRGMIRNGAMFAADAATWALCGGRGAFVPWQEAIERDCSARIAEWLSDHPGETLDPAKWYRGEKAQIVAFNAAPRSTITASSVADRIAARKAGQRVAEGNGLARNEVPGMAMTGTGIGNDLPMAQAAVGGIQ